MSTFPAYRPRRLRKNEKIRAMVRETEISSDHLVYPLFVKEMAEDKVPVLSMPGIYQFSVEGLMREIEELVDVGVPAIMLFGIPGEEGRDGQRRLRRKRDRPARGEGDQEALRRRYSRDYRCVHVRIYEPRPLRGDKGRRGRQRRDRASSLPRAPSAMLRQGRIWSPLPI